MFVADDLAAWLVGLFADAGRRRLITWVIGSDQERALQKVAAAAIDLSVVELRPEGGARAQELALVVGQVFAAPAPEALLADCATMLEALQAGIAGQLAPLDDASLTGTNDSSAELLGLSAAVLAESLTTHLMREIVNHGARGGPLQPLADQLNHDATHIGIHRIEILLGRLARDVTYALASLDITEPAAAPSGSLDVQRFDELLAEPMVGRAWLVAEIEAFCQKYDRGYFFIEGDAGMGKTTFAAWLAKEKHCAAHFAQLDPDAGTTAMAAHSIGAKLIADWNLDTLAAKVACTKQIGCAQWLREVFKAAAHRRDEVCPGKPIMVVVDALDAAAEDWPGHLPLGLPDRLPSGVYVVATVRTGGLRHDPREHAPREYAWRSLGAMTLS